MKKTILALGVSLIALTACTSENKYNLVAVGDTPTAFFDNLANTLSSTNIIKASVDGDKVSFYCLSGYEAIGSMPVNDGENKSFTCNNLEGCTAYSSAVSHNIPNASAGSIIQNKVDQIVAGEETIINNKRMLGGEETRMVCVPSSQITYWSEV